MAQKNSKKEIKWDKLDNTAHIFPVIAGESMSNVYRISVTLQEEIKQELLQEALERVLPWFEVFRCGSAMAYSGIILRQIKNQRRK